MFKLKIQAVGAPGSSSCICYLLLLAMLLLFAITLNGQTPDGQNLSDLIKQILLALFVVPILRALRTGSRRKSKLLRVATIAPCFVLMCSLAEADQPLIVSLPPIYGWTEGNPESVWQQSLTHRVRISAAIDSAGVVAHAYLSTAPGVVDASHSLVSFASGNLIAETTIYPTGGSACAPFINCVQTLDQFTTLFTGLTLGPGQYYLTISGAWFPISRPKLAISAPDIVVREGATWGFPVPFAVIEESASTQYAIVSAKTASLVGEPAGSGPFKELYYRIIASHSGKVLDVAGTSCADGAEIIQETASGQDSQLWSFEPTQTGAFVIVNKASGKVLDVGSRGLGDGVNIEQWTGVSNESSQAFSIQSVGDALYRFVSASSDRVFDIEAKSLTDGAPLQQEDWLGASQDNGNQRFWLQAVSQVVPGVQRTCR